MATGSLDTAAHVSQLALTPVFLLTAVGSLLNVFSSRLARAVDRIHLLKQQADRSVAELDRLRLRSQSASSNSSTASRRGASAKASAIIASVSPTHLDNRSDASLTSSGRSSARAR